MKKRIIFILTLTLTLNALSVFSAVELDMDLSASPLLSSTMDTESSLLSALTFSTLPIEIVTHLVQTNGLLAPVLQKLPVKKSNETKQRNASADLALLAEPGNIILKSIGRAWGIASLFLPCPQTEGALPVNSGAASLPETGKAVVLFLLGYIVVLALSNLPWNNAVPGTGDRTILSSGFFIY